jgi:aspartate carbamoyltransferase
MNALGLLQKYKHRVPDSPTALRGARDHFRLDRRMKALFNDFGIVKDLWNSNQRSFFCLEPAAAIADVTPLPAPDLRTDHGFAGQSVTSARQFSRAAIESVVQLADEYRARIESGERLRVLDGKIMATLFYEPSTRTRLSFEAAMHRLGGAVISIADGGTSSSAVKGESIADSIHTVAGYADIIVQRHPAYGSADEAACAARSHGVPVINAGDGAGEHPTQALLDIYTMLRERHLETLNGLRIVLAGDLKHGRTVHSLFQVLGRWSGVQIVLAAPTGLELPCALRDAPGTGCIVTATTDLAAAVEGADILYMTRVQKERFVDQAAYEALKGAFRVDADFMHAHPWLTLMHPLPRVDEIAPNVDSHPNAAYFRQTQNGLYVRMALLALVAGAAH